MITPMATAIRLFLRRRADFSSGERRRSSISSPLDEMIFLTGSFTTNSGFAASLAGFSEVAGSGNGLAASGRASTGCAAVEPAEPASGGRSESASEDLWSSGEPDAGPPGAAGAVFGTDLDTGEILSGIGRLPGEVGWLGLSTGDRANELGPMPGGKRSPSVVGDDCGASTRGCRAAGALGTSKSIAGGELAEADAGGAALGCAGDTWPMGIELGQFVDCPASRGAAGGPTDGGEAGGKDAGGGVGG